MNYPIVRIAHRGASAEYPENTLLAFRRAIEQGVDMLELDVHLTRDGGLVVIHDSTLERTTNGSGWVRDHLLSEIRRLDAGQGERVPTLTEVIDLARSSSIRLSVEVKGETEAESLAITEAVVRALENTGFLRQAVVNSFWPAAILRVKALQPRLATSLNLPLEDGSLTPRQVVEQTLAAGANCISYDFRFLTEPVIHEARLSGLSVWAWDPDDAEDIRRVWRWGVSGVISNRPDVLNEVLRESSF